MIEKAIRIRLGNIFDKARMLADHLTEHPEISGEEKGVLWVYHKVSKRNGI